ncbi:DUF6089 family protein [Fulvivirga lutea]|uniref:Outer membrane beta-barrel protein n=1 Tax=Fulvivirga lutea TaxID=2810512 RepID=A0A974WFV4_9BACT|nr:DUF6089 family protein [Fulvivirga lutea]QSE96788.1 outer membrane beta-barrel protein [Fulvivirga lutea]
MRLNFIIGLFLLGFSSDLVGQSFFNYRRGRDFIASVGSGTSTYFGDLKDDGEYFDFKPHLNVGLSYFFNGNFGARAEIQWFQLEGSDKNSSDENKIERNLSFQSNNFEFNVVGIYQAFTSNGSRYYQRPSFNLYGFAGLGLLYFNPTAELDGKKYALQPIATEGVSYSRVTLVIPYGLGVRIKVNPFWNLAIEGGFRQTFTDYIDDVSTNYIDNSSFRDPVDAALADRNLSGTPREAGRIRGNSEKNDNYFLMNIKVEFYLPADLLSSAKLKSGRPGKRRKR